MLATVRDPASGGTIEQALVLFFEGPNSETGEDVVELQLHGGRAVIAATFAALSRLPGLRPAEGGEFTRRGFESGKLDLTAVEGLADLIFADTEAQRRQAVRQLQGLLGDRAENWRLRLIEAMALAEAGIDFSDEADVAADVAVRSLDAARLLQQEIAALLAEGRRGERLREGLVVAIAGPPKAGKSTLLNRIARRDVAIVSPHAGTTRDVIEVHLDLDGLPVALLDTAGLRETADPVEIEGIRRARYLAGSRFQGASVDHSVVSDGCRIGRGSTLIDSVIGVRSQINENVTVRESYVMGADFYETDEDRAENLRLKRPAYGIGANSVIQKAIVDKNVRIGRNVRLLNEQNVQELDTPYVTIRDGIIVVPKWTIIPDGYLI